jgi:multidrug efflux pump subunit AcrA (membrane-fusion protein)
MKPATYALAVGLLFSPVILAGVHANPFAPRPVTVRRQDFVSPRTLLGTLAPLWRADVAAPADGWIRSVTTDVGKRVAKDEPLATLAPVAKAGASATKPMTITAPLDGVVVTRAVSLGSYVHQGQPLFTVADDTKMRVRASLLEKDCLLVREGDKTTVEVELLPSKVFEGQVSAVLPWIDPATRQREIECLVANPDRLLIAGMTGKLIIPIELRKNVLVVPREALMREKGQASVFVVREGRARKVKILLGLEEKPLFEVRDGLSDGDVVLVNPQFAKDGMPITLP